MRQVMIQQVQDSSKLAKKYLACCLLYLILLSSWLLPKPSWCLIARQSPSHRITPHLTGPYGVRGARLLPFEVVVVRMVMGYTENARQETKQMHL